VVDLESVINYSQNMTETQNQIPDSLVEKIKALLRLSTSGNEHEANLAMQRAKSLAIKYELDLATLDAFDDGKPKINEPITKDNLDLAKRMSVCQHHVTDILQSYFNTKILYGGGRHYGRHLIFIGRARDIELAKFLNDHLNNEFLRLWRKYYADNEKNGVTLRDRGGFMYGLKQGLAEKLEESQKQTEQEVFGNTVAEKIEKVKECYSLMTINLKSRIEDKTAEFYPHLRKAARSHTMHNCNSLGAGRAMGRTINLNRPLGYSGSKQIN
jgi:hypothetical protein